jgi:hypothetical protein
LQTSKNRNPGLLGLALAMLLTLSCSDGGSSPTEPQPTIDSIAVETITPARGTALSAGSQVTFQARVRYTLATADSGRISMIIQDQASRNLSRNPQPRAQIVRGGGVVELSDTITIPATGVTRVDVFVPLFPGGATSTGVVQLVQYPVQ